MADGSVPRFIAYGAGGPYQALPLAPTVLQAMSTRSGAETFEMPIAPGASVEIAAVGELHFGGISGMIDMLLDASADAMAITVR